LIRTIGLILDFSALESGAFAPDFKSTNIIEEIILPAVKEFEPEASKKGIDLNYVGNTKEQIILKVDKYTLSQTITNLIHNGIKYTNKGFVEIDCERKNDKILIKVRDSGVGISEEFIPHLFDKFSQESGGYTRKYDGNGLGLALVKKYSEVNNSRIEVSSKKDHGTEFRIIFDQ
jgi:signal transduction histidine kinase